MCNYINYNRHGINLYYTKEFHLKELKVDQLVCLCAHRENKTKPTTAPAKKKKMKRRIVWLLFSIRAFASIEQIQTALNCQTCNIIDLLGIINLVSENVCVCVWLDVGSSVFVVWRCAGDEQNRSTLS